ncbi:helix-hairpin-helix domain-containing protein [Vitreoscilla massiliensis]|uniref:Helix-hairpin-helix domain-containing protein n=1 Tax=Vitreoscilla massiliensis TaxID=1689272 RepID=A0ABY4DX72_9NEIS|nr:helix-hairpin-helix domain-containing protein [Vitreoscilla massiliensis]UOO88117.1 helix-hairpin-helix domain-containing protein [Vitreoscilla massiliensis]
MKHLFIALLALLLTSPVWAAININTATEAELQTLSGIGPSKAKAIVEYRKQNGNFKTTADIKNVKGIGDGIFNKISAEISVTGTAAKAAPKPATAPAAKPAAKKSVPVKPAA